MKKKTMLLMSFVLAVVMSVAVFAAGCGGGISRGGGGGQQMNTQDQWNAAVTLTQTRLAETNREMRWTQESRSEYRADGNNRMESRSSSRVTIGNGGNHIQWDDGGGIIYSQFTAGDADNFTFERDANGVWRRYEGASRPSVWFGSLPGLGNVLNIPLEYFDFSGGRHVLNQDRFMAARRAEWILGGNSAAEWDLMVNSSDRVRVEITFRDGVVTNVYTYMRTRHPRETREMRTTINWGWSGSVSLPTHVPFPAS